MDIQILTDQQRQEMLMSHPVITKQYLIITPVITKVYSLIRDRVYMRTTGTFMYATPRMGKTTCASAIQTLLEAEFPNIFVIRFIAEPSKQQSAMLIDILSADKLAIPKSARYKELQKRLMTHIQSSLVMRNGKQFVLMIDEMQNLSEENLTDLATIHNRLEPLGIKMTTIGFGQPEIMARRSALLATNQSFLIARFLSEPIPFSGCASKEDLEEILRSYDEKQFYPEDSDYTFTRFFLPMAYENGFRLIQYAKSIWLALRKSAAGLAIDSIPMEHLSRTIEFLLVVGQQKDDSKFKLTPNDIKTAVQASNLSYFSGLMGSTPPE
jgi:hypothetical protein